MNTPKRLPGACDLAIPPLRKPHPVIAASERMACGNRQTIGSLLSVEEPGANKKKIGAATVLPFAWMPDQSLTYFTLVFQKGICKIILSILAFS